MDRRKQAEDNYRKRFEELGLSERFEFLRREWSKQSDRRFWSRCKTCGEEFLIWNDVLRGKQKHLLCPACGAASDGNDIFSRSPIVDKIAAFYAQGHSVSETSEHFGVTKVQVNNLVKARGITNGRSFRSFRQEDNQRRSEAAEQKIVELLKARGFSYIGGYKNNDSSVSIKCLKCGTECSRTVNVIKDGTVRCLECQKRETKERQAAERKARVDQAEVKRIEREWYRRFHPRRSEYEDLHEAFLNRTGICEICGKSYTVRDYVESCGLKHARDNGVCSDKCRRTKSNRNVHKSHKQRGVCDNHRHRARKFDCKYDSSVTLKKLVDRDGLRCAICGELCDWDDRSWSEYSGPRYPSIDHIVPMSKGGGHTWDNVQVAHMICNSQKGNKVVNE